MRITEYLEYLNANINYDKLTHLTISNNLKRIRRRKGGRGIPNISPNKGKSPVGLHRIDGSVAIQDGIDYIAGGRGNLHCGSNKTNSPGVVCGNPPALPSNAEHQARAVASRPECGCSQSNSTKGVR